METAHPLQLIVHFVGCEAHRARLRAEFILCEKRYIAESFLASPLGASSPSVVYLVVRRLALLIVVGLVLGIGGSLGLSRFIGALLFGVAARDAVTFCVRRGSRGDRRVRCERAGDTFSRLDPGQVLRES
jgi:hypothetical protein